MSPVLRRGRAAFMVAVGGLLASCARGAAPAGSSQSPASVVEPAPVSSDQGKPAKPHAQERQAANNAERWVKKRDDVTGELVLSSSVESCPLELRAQVISEQLHVGRYGACGLPKVEYEAIWADMLSAVLKELGPNPALHLNWGRVISPENDASFPGVAHRLASLAHASAEWDNQAGKPTNGDYPGQFIVSSIPAAELFPELENISRRIGLARVSVAHVEKVLVGKPPEKLGQLPGGKLPYDGQFVFELSGTFPK